MSARSKSVTCQHCGRSVRANKSADGKSFVVVPHTADGSRVRYVGNCQGSGQRA